ncbi:diacylglycerol O-acyltransferase 2 [Oncorhynchus mykiss]|uniref:diacylglycerol O-acyltransferase 2 n=1 Tax=Oncorhynchus mykiss TaxID=8022 RepID=UPI0018781730|nr:diacylglycerol O-acyltransferase 2 [Oncorhynchus mykiss]
MYLSTYVSFFSEILRCLLDGTGSVLLSALQSLLSVRWAWYPRLEKQVQVFSVMQSIVSFLIMGPISSVVMLYLLWTDLWCVTASCTIWLFYDWNTQTRQANRYIYIATSKNTVGLIKTHNLLPNRNYILGYHPHGIGALCNFATESNGFLAKFPGITPFVATLAGNFHMPLAREYLMSAGLTWCLCTHLERIMCISI